MKGFLLILCPLLLLGCQETTATPEVPKKVPHSQTFRNIGLRTNTALSSIPIEDVLSGGPPKDGIPALKNPRGWDSVDEAKTWLQDDHEGILYQAHGEKRFYPYDILYWHEIVNDKIFTGERHRGKKVYDYFAVTFCPLCGSGVIFDRTLEGQLSTFGVSGKLWESNLLMYDTATESLWSQILGEAVVGDLTGKKLQVLPSNILTFGEVREHFPEAHVLNRQTGYRRAYGTSPYGDYEENRFIMFPTGQTDERFHPKEIFHITNFENASVGFQRKRLLEEGRGEISVNGQILTAKLNNDKTLIIEDPKGKRLPHYAAMWFSWVTHQKLEKIVWPRE